MFSGMTGTALLVWLWLLAARSSAEWDYRHEGEKGNTRGCANLTLVLDNWKFAIMTQVKDLLLNHHSAVLPDYGRIQPLSDALGDLYRELNTLKERLGALTSRLGGMEEFVEDMRAGRVPRPAHPERLAPPTAQGDRKRILSKQTKRPQA
ncbi:hypothetical protein AAFF_G00254910 [Aldrovandia affinis]|uniref:Uncharacterized protein n=1 Tax=Aldrovandia affinis TaxID=143900 RepID=A0AAD7W320_9TELE|nr:hypothetical protein AAFF_G00254910 [Aldrovandia affinis]